jgi:hypothetical protein
MFEFWWQCLFGVSVCDGLALRPSVTPRDELDDLGYVNQAAMNISGGRDCRAV